MHAFVFLPTHPICLCLWCLYVLAWSCMCMHNVLHVSDFSEQKSPATALLSLQFYSLISRAMNIWPNSWATIKHSSSQEAPKCAKSHHQVPWCWFLLFSLNYKKGSALWFWSIVAFQGSICGFSLIRFRTFRKTLLQHISKAPAPCGTTDTHLDRPPQPWVASEAM